MLQLRFYVIQVFIEAVRGNGYQGDIAIDDITFTSQSCTLSPAAAKPVASTAPPSTTTMMPGTIPTGFTCNFDANVCGWKQDRTDNFDWSRFHGATQSGGTGPTTDHSASGGIDWYILFLDTGI